MTLSIPEQLDDLTPAWLTDALQAEGEIPATTRVVSVEREMLGEGAGFLGDIARLTLAYEGGDGPGSVVAKLPKLANRSMGELLGAYERESCFYAELAAELPLATPHMYYGAFDRDAASERQAAAMSMADRTPRFLASRMTQLAKWISSRKKRRYILLLEDLQGAELGDQVAGIPPERCARVLREVARMHAAFWSSTTIEGRFWLLPLDIDARIRHALFRDSNPAFRKQFAHLVDNRFERALQWAEEHGAQAVRELQRRAPVTLLHCDLRLDNVAFRGDTPVVFDWQLVRRGAAAYDVAYFLSGASPDLSPQDETDLLREYHTALGELGVRDYAFEAFERDYQLGLLTAMQTLTSLDQMDLGDGRGIPLMEAWFERLRARIAGIDLDRLP